MLHWTRVPVAAALCVLDYAAARALILTKMATGATLDGLVGDGLVEPSDVETLSAALDEGRTKGWCHRYRQAGGFHFLAPVCGGAIDDDDPTVEMPAVVVDLAAIAGDDDRSIPPDAVLIPPELEDLDELFGAVEADAPDYAATQRPGYRESLRAAGVAVVPAETFEPFDPCGPPLPPVCGGAIDPRDDEPAYTDREWDEMCRDSRVYGETLYGYE